jgi:hypothetical protein
MSIFSKSKVFVLQGGEFYRVEGPKHFLDNINAFGGHIIIGDEIEVATSWLGTNQISSNSINGFSVDKMELSQNSYLDFNDIPADDKYVTMKHVFQAMAISSLFGLLLLVFVSWSSALILGIFFFVAELVGFLITRNSVFEKENNK